jgi:hypothetical protein
MSDKPAFRISPPLAALGLFVVMAIGFGIWYALQKAPPPLEISERTTVVTTPLDERGRIDYETPLNDILGRGVTPETNALVALTRVLGPRPEGGRGMPADWWERIGADKPPEDGDYLKDDTIKWLNDLIVGDNGEENDRKQAIRDEEDRLRSEPWTTKDSPHMAGWIRSNDKPLSLVAEAVKRPHYYHPLIARDKDGNKQDLYFALLPYCQKMRAIASVLSIRAMWHLGEGRMDSAWADLMTIHRLGGLMILNPGSVVEYLVGVAIRTISMQRIVKIIEVTKPDLAQLTRWKNEFQEKPVNPNWEKVVGVCERYYGLDGIVGLQANLKMNRTLDSALFGHVSAKKQEADRGLLQDTNWNEVLTQFNQKMDEMTKLMIRLSGNSLLHEERLKLLSAMKDLEQSIAQEVPANKSDQLAKTILKELVPGIARMTHANLRLQQYKAFLGNVFLLEEHRLQNGIYPEWPDYSNYSGDIITGEPFRYKRIPGGYYLHSVGQNKKDDFNEQFDEPSHGDDVVVKVIRK